MNDSSCIFEIIYNTMQQSHNTMSIKTLCAMAGVSRSGYYAWLNAAPQERSGNSRTEMTLNKSLLHIKCTVIPKAQKASIWLFFTWIHPWL